jgi:hypothetical protein
MLGSHKYLRTALLSLAMIVLISLGWLAWQIHYAKSMVASTFLLQESGGNAYFGYQVDESGNYLPENGIRKRSGPAWLMDRDATYEFLFNDVVSIEVFKASAMEKVRLFPTIRYLQFRCDTLDITDETIKHLSGLSELRDLCLTQSSVTDEGVAQLRGLTSLTYLNLSDTEITGKELAKLRDSTQLRDLDVYMTGFSDAGVASLSSFKNLEALDLGRTKITDDAIPRLALLPKLDCLSVKATSVSDSGVRHLKGIRQLKSLSLANCYGVTDASVEDLKALVNLEWLCLGGTRVSPQAARAIRDALPGCTISGIDLTSSGNSDDCDK